MPPEHLGAWLRDFDELLREHGLDGVPYGHFGDGCVHVRIDFPFVVRGEAEARRAFRDFLTACALKLREHGGSLSGEHGDGRARSELLPLMYDAESLRLFGAVKAICDPDNLLNPGNIVDPAPLDADLRAVRPRLPIVPALRFVHDGGELANAVHRCTGVGKCVAAVDQQRDVPLVPRHPRGEGLHPRPGPGAPGGARRRAGRRARRPGGRRGARPLPVLQGLRVRLPDRRRHGDVQGRGAAPEVRRPGRAPAASAQPPHRSAGCRAGPRWPPRSRPSLNRALRLRPVATLARAGAGIDQRRSIPTFATTTLRRSRRASSAPDAPDVWIWADSFTDHFLPQSGHAAIRVLEAAGLRVRVIDEDACCGLTWVTTGQLDAARAIMGRTVATLAPYVASGVPVIGLEPSCLATLRSDAVELSGDPRAAQVAEGVLTFAELLTRLDWTPPDLTGVEVVAQPHCHQASVLGWAADEALLRRAGASRDPGRRLLRAGRQLRHGEGALRGLRRGGRDPPAAGRPGPPRTPWCSPTACPAGCSSTTWRASRRCTSPSCSRLESRGEAPPSPPRDPRRAGGAAAAGGRRRGDEPVSAG